MAHTTLPHQPIPRPVPGGPCFVSTVPTPNLPESRPQRRRAAGLSRGGKPPLPLVRTAPVVDIHLLWLSDKAEVEALRREAEGLRARLAQPQQLLDELDLHRIAEGDRAAQLEAVAALHAKAEAAETRHQEEMRDAIQRLREAGHPYSA